MAAIRNHKRLPIICRNRRLRIEYPKEDPHSSSRSSSVVVHSQEELEIKHEIEHQKFLLTSSCSDEKTKSSSAANAVPCEPKSPRIFQDQPKEKKTKSSSASNALPTEPKSPIFQDQPKEKKTKSSSAANVVPSEKKTPIFIDQPKEKKTNCSSAANAVPSGQKSPLFKDQPKEKRTKSSSAANAVPSEKKTPIFKDQPKEKKNSSINSAPSAPISGEQNSCISELLDRHVKENQKTTPKSKKRPHSAIFTTSSAGSCMECSQLLMPVQYGEGNLQIHGADHVRHYTSVRCYYCNSASKRQRFVRNDDGADLHIMHDPKKSDSPQSSRYFSCNIINLADS
jgi:hypothetical protein